MNDIERKYFKIWIVAVIIITIIYVCFCDTGISINEFSEEQRTYVKQLLPKQMNHMFPQPLGNFVEPVDVWSSIPTT
jgi:hypothetical protein